jgi:hypothetical protein
MTDKPETRAVLQERILRVEQRNEQLEYDMREMRAQRDIARKRAEEAQDTIDMKDMTIAGLLKLVHRYEGAIAIEAQDTIAMKDMTIAGLLKLVHRYEGAIAIMSSGAFDSLARIDNPHAD